VKGNDPLQGQLVDGRYRLARRVGSGGMSVVYLAQREEGEQRLAIKFLRSAFANLPDFVRRFEQEAQACRLLDHDNCVTVLDFGVAFGSPYLVMEYMDGRMLFEELSAGPLAVRRAIDIARQVLRGLAHAHERGVVHRDLKPGNIMLLDDGSGGTLAKIMDFGTAQLMTGEQPTGRVGTDVGTPWYMAPEQAAGQPTDPRTDIYSVGVILFEMLTGERPYTADDPMRVLQMHLSSPIPSARALKPEMGLSPELEAAMVRAMQKQPADRFNSALELDAALGDVPELRPRRPSGPLQPVQRPVAPPPPVAPEPPDVAGPPPASGLVAGAPPTRRPLVIALTLATGIIALGLLVLLLYQTGVLGR